MKRGGNEVAEAVLALAAGNVAYLLVSIVFLEIADLAYTDFAHGPFAGNISTLVSVWITTGYLIGILDLLAIVAVFGSATGGGRR